MFDLHDNCRALQLDVDCPQTHQRPILSGAPPHPEEPKECASQQPSHISPTSTTLDTRTAAHLLGLVAICTPELHTVPDLEARSAVFWRESRNSERRLALVLPPPDPPPPAAPTPTPPPPAAAFVPSRPPAKSFRLLPNSTTKPFSFRNIFHIIWQIFIRRVSLVQVAGKL